MTLRHQQSALVYPSAVCLFACLLLFAYLRLLAYLLACFIAYLLGGLADHHRHRHFCHLPGTSPILSLKFNEHIVTFFFFFFGWNLVVLPLTQTLVRTLKHVLQRNMRRRQSPGMSSPDIHQNTDVFNLFFFLTILIVSYKFNKGCDSSLVFFYLFCC